MLLTNNAVEEKVGDILIVRYFLYRFTGSNCQTEINECDSAPCQNGATCQVNGLGRYRCHCPYGYTGEHCESYIDWCETNPCKNGVCTQEYNRFKCQCAPGWIGMVCDVEMVSCVDAALRKGKSFIKNVK